jgi:hypothetical protein
VPIPPEHNDELDAAIEAGAPRQTPPQQQKYGVKKQEGDSLLEDAAEVVVDGVGLDGCLLRPVVWLLTLPIRLIGRIIEAFFD